MSNWIEYARSVIRVEVDGLLKVSETLDQSFEIALDLIHSCNGKLIFTGIGKSGHIAQKCASTFSSTGTPSLFLHPAEALHGDLGIVVPGDLVIAISYGGESPELMSILKYCRRKDIRIIAITGKRESSLGKHSDVTLDVSVASEACPLGLAPTASSTATLALGDALAMCVLKKKGFTDKDFAERHPAGSLGFRLLTKVKDIMHSGGALPLVQEQTPLSEVLTIMTAREVRGAAGVLDASSNLIGAITDGDIRRFFEKNSSEGKFVFAKDIMSIRPTVIDESELAERALLLMENKKIQMLFVKKSGADDYSKPIGILGIQDLLNAKVR